MYKQPEIKGLNGRLVNLYLNILQFEIKRTRLLFQLKEQETQRIVILTKHSKEICVILKMKLL